MFACPLVLATMFVLVSSDSICESRPRRLFEPSDDERNLQILKVGTIIGALMIILGTVLIFTLQPQVDIPTKIKDTCSMVTSVIFSCGFLGVSYAKICR